MRIYLAGQKYFGQEVFKLCRELGHEIVGVCAPAWAGRYSNIPYVFGDEETMRPDRLRAIAELNGIPWLPSGQLRAETLPGNVGLIIAAHSHDFIGKRTRLKAELGAVGYHPSLLPIHRGRDAIKWALKMGDRVTGGSVYWLNDTVDGGPIAAQDYCLVRPGDTPDELWQRELQPMGLRLMRQVLTDLQSGVIVSIPQDPKLATWEPYLDPPPLHRPDLLMLGAAPNGMRVITSREELYKGSVNAE